MERPGLLFVQLFLAALAIFFSYQLWILAAKVGDAHFDLDSPYYVRVAEHFAHTGRLVDPEKPKVIPLQTLGYPFFVGTIFKFFGEDFNYVVLLQIVLNICIGFFIFSIAQILFNRSIACIAMFLWSINLGYLVFAQFILTDLLLAFFLIAALWAYVHAWQQQSNFYAGIAGLLYGVSIAVKPVALFYMPFLCVWLFFENFIKSWKMILWLLIGFFLPVISYVTYNAYTFNRYIIAPLAQENIHRYFLAYLLAADKKISYQEGKEEVAQLLNHKNYNDENVWQPARELLKSYCANKPLLVIKVWLWNMLKTLCASYSTQLKLLVNPSLKGAENSFFQKKGTMLEKFYFYLLADFKGSFAYYVALINLLYMVILLVCLPIGFIALLYYRQYQLLLFLLVTIVYFSFITGHDGCARYRLMFEHIYIIMAAVGIYALTMNIMKKDIHKERAFS